MSRFFICAVRDNAVGAFMAPMVFRSHAEAVRSFTDAVLAEGSVFAKHAHDYRLFQVGEWDDQAGLVIEVSSPLFLIGGENCLPLSTVPGVGPQRPVVELELDGNGVKAGRNRPM